MNQALAIIDATAKAHLDKLTIHRMPGALPFAGKYRLIDFALSNMKNANITNVAIFPYGNYRSLQDHVGSGKRWDLDRRRDGLFILPPKNMTLATEDMLT
ncbi:MAG: glucose-1-phosphate adenylyltransferase, partial [Acholeplasmatales bacterium]